MKKVVIIGVGALGKRHLEAVLKTEFANGLGIGLKKERERSIMDNS